MSLSCDCGWDDGDFDSYFMPPDDYTTLKTRRRKRCCSCKTLIDVGAVCTEFNRYRHPAYDSIEEKIYGEGGEVPLASYYHCEKCADIYFSLDELGYCISIDEDMRQLAKEYAEQHKKEAA